MAARWGADGRAPVAVGSASAGVVASYVVVSGGRVLVQREACRVFRAASLVKLLIALEQLERADDPLLGPMLRSSDDAAASELWRRNGGGAIVARMARTIGLAETVPPPVAKPGFWGYSALSAADVVRIYRYLLERAPAGARDVVLGHLRQATECGTDGFDQYFGIPRAVERPWAVKQGWSGFEEPRVDGLTPALGAGRPVLHTTGVVGDRIVAVLTLQPAGTSAEEASRQVTALTGEVFRAAGG